MPRDLRVKEQNGLDHLCCPHCSLMYPTLNEKGAPVQIPDTCTRCRCPMDYKKARVFGETQAKAHHNPELTRIGRTIRGSTSAVLDAPPIDDE